MDTYEKKYKELVSKIKKAYLYAQTDSTKAVLEDILPELAESEDEKIRKSIIENLKGNMYRADGDYDLLNKQIAWLEKQQSVEEIVERCKDSWYNEGKIAGMAEGLSDDEKYQQGWHDAVEQGKRLENYDWYEKGRADAIEDTCKWLSQQGDMLEDCFSDINDFVDLYKEAVRGGEKPQGKSALEAIKEKPADNANKVEQKFHEGEWVVWDNKISCHIDNIYQVKESLMYAVTDTNNMIRTYSGKDFDRNAHLWTLQDAKNGDVLYSLDSNQPFIYKERNIHEQATAYCGINKYGKFFVWNTKDCIITLDKYIPATKSQRDALFVEMEKAGYIFDFDKKELKEIEQNSAWSEEDEQNCSGIIDEIAVNKSEAPESDYKTYDRFIDWLKSLKDKVQFHWKPSGEQIDAFEHFVKSIGESGFAYPHNHNTKCVYSLLNDLKKL